VRALLVPSLMKLFGNANWWAPGWMRRIYNKIGLSH
jgi:RND superfamily putative drug exporter